MVEENGWPNQGMENVACRQITVVTNRGIQTNKSILRVLLRDNERIETFCVFFTRGAVEVKSRSALWLIILRIGQDSGPKVTKKRHNLR